MLSANGSSLTALVLSDNLLVAAGLIALLDGASGVEVMGQTRDHTEFFEMIDDAKPDAVIVTIFTSAGVTPTLAAVRRLHQEHPDLAMLIIADHGNGLALEVLRSGAWKVAFLLEQGQLTQEAIVRALEDACAGHTVLDPSIVEALVLRRSGMAVDDLSPRELDVLEQISLGLSNGAIATELSVSVKCVEKYVTAIFRKLGLTERLHIDRRVTAARLYLRPDPASLVAG